MNVRWVALGITALLLAGCAEPPAEPRATVDDAPGHELGIEESAKGRIYRVNASAPATYGFLSTWTIVPATDARVRVAGIGSFGSWASYDACAVWGAWAPGALPVEPNRDAERTSNGPGADPDGPGGVVAHFAWRNNPFGPEVAAGNVVAEPPHAPGDDYGVGGLEEHAVEFDWVVPAGSPIHVRVGTDDVRYLRDEQNSLEMAINVSGPSHIERGASVPMRCGVNFFATDEPTVRAYGALSGVTVGGDAVMETRNATTLLFATDFAGYSSDARSFRVFYPGHEPQQVDRFYSSSGATGRAGFEVDQWPFELVSDPYWLIADEAWPWLSVVSP